LTKDQDIRLGK